MNNRNLSITRKAACKTKRMNTVESFTEPYIKSNTFAWRAVLGLLRTAYEMIPAAMKSSLSRAGRMWKAVGVVCVFVCMCVCV